MQNTCMTETQRDIITNAYESLVFKDDFSITESINWNSKGDYSKEDNTLDFTGVTYGEYNSDDETSDDETSDDKESIKVSVHVVIDVATNTLVEAYALSCKTGDYLSK